METVFQQLGFTPREQQLRVEKELLEPFQKDDILMLDGPTGLGKGKVGMFYLHQMVKRSTYVEDTFKGAL